MKSVADLTMSICIYECILKETDLEKFSDTHPELPMGWLRSVGSIKSQVSFAEYRLFCRALLQMRPII